MRKNDLFMLVSMMILIASIVATCLEKNQFISYTEFEKQLLNGDVAQVQLVDGTNIARVTYNEDDDLRLVRYVSNDSMLELVKKQGKHGNEIGFEIKKIDIISKLRITGRLPFAIAVAIVVVIIVSKLIKWYKDYYAYYDEMQQTTDENTEAHLGGVNSLQTDAGADTIEIVKGTEPKVKFDDVAGIDEEREQVVQIVDFLKNPSKYKEMGAQIPKGVLLIGAPGTGKTLLARAIAGEAKATFFEVTGSSFEEKYVGVGAARVRELFKQAKKYSPSIIFIDEIDCVAAKRYETKNNSEATLNQLLAEMDGFNSFEDVIVIAATNYAEILDEAITRPGRFDRKVYIPMPDIVARKKILEVHAKNKKLSKEISLDKLAQKTTGFAGADLKNLLNEAAILAVTKGTSEIQKNDIDEAFARVMVGLEKKNRIVSEEERYETAIHEAGHAIVSAVLRPDVEILGVSIVQRGNAGGYNFFNSKEKTYYYKKEAISDMIVLYAGKVAEEMCVKKISSGPSSDLSDASKIASNMVNRFGMGDSLVTLTGNSEFDSILLKQNMPAIEKICQDAYDSTKKIVFENINAIEELADLLMKKENLSSEELKEFLSKKKLTNSYKL